MKRFAFIGLALILIINLSSFSQNDKKQTNKKPTATKSKASKSDKVAKAELSIADIFENRARVILKQPDSIHKAIVISTSPEKVSIDTTGPVMAPPNKISLYNGIRLTDDATLLFATFYGYAEFTINALAPRTQYYLQVYNIKDDKYEFVAQKDFFTLAPEPKIQAHGIVFDDVTESSISIKWINGNGEGRIVVVSKDKDPNFPEDCATYQVIKDISKAEPNLKDSWVVFDSKSKESELKLENLQTGTYYFQIFEYNGDSIFRNYNVIFTNVEGNPRAKATVINAPKLNPAMEITKWGFTLNWQAVNGASSYLLEIATDKDFKENLPNYDAIDIGLNTTYKIMDLEPDKKYFARIKAINRRGEGVYSNIIEVKTTK